MRAIVVFLFATFATGVVVAFVGLAAGGSLGPGEVALCFGIGLVAAVLDTLAERGRRREA
jgi:hypothetical protein